MSDLLDRAVSAAMPGAIAAVAALVICHGVGPTVFAIIALVYAACAVCTGALIIVPRARETFSVKDALGSDLIKKLGTHINIGYPAAAKAVS